MLRNRVLRTIADYTLMTIGALLVAFSVTAFLTPNQVVTGGITGIAILLNGAIGTPVGLVVLLLNLPLLLFGFRQLGGVLFGLRTLYATTVMALAIDAFRPFVPVITADPLLFCLYGGLLDGVGVGLVLRARGTTGGVDIIARIVEQRFGLPPGRTILFTDALIFLGALVSYGPEKILYALLVVFISSRALDYTLAGGGGARQALVVTDVPEAITAAVMADLGRGVTQIEGRGGYTGAARAVLLCVVARPEVSALRELVAAADPHAFMVIGEVDEVLGEGFRPVAKPKRKAQSTHPE